MPKTPLRSGSVHAVKEALRRVEEGADLFRVAAEVAQDLVPLTERVRRLNQLGGEFAGVRLTPSVERLRAAIAAKSC